MERLTQRGEIDHNFGVWVKEGFSNNGLKTFFNEYDEGFSAINKCAEYEDLEEQGFLLRLPCKVKDRFWELNTANGVPYIYPRMAHSLQHCVYVLERLGKTTFLTKEEAEQKFKEIKGE